MPDERRKKTRLEVHLPMKVKGADGELIDMELVDVSASGLRVRGDALAIFEQEANGDGKSVTFELHLSAKLAWIEPRHDGDFDLGLTLST